MALAMTASRVLTPAELMFGGIWIGPGSGNNGDGSRPDLGQANADATVRAAYDAGIVEFDTAPWYGAGSSEDRLGRALRGIPNARVTTKTGRLFTEPDGTPALEGFDAPGRMYIQPILRLSNVPIASKL
jgi:aryl-alcohol dehydrogenase-like predicted oxidoreductase